MLQYLIKYCEHCQKYSQLLGRFTIIFKDNLDFHYNVIINITYIEGKPILQLVNKAIQFQGR